MKPILKVENVRKIYPGVEALKGVTIEFYRGEVHAIVGENGAGKSTLVEIICGSLKPTEGRVLIDGKEMRGGILEATKLGIAIVHQERSLIPSFNAVENVFLGNENFFLNDKEKLRELQKLMDQTGLYVSTHLPVKYLGEGERQLIDILKILRQREPKVLILDEPTSALTQESSERLFELIQKLKSKGITIIIITHRIEEVFKIADRVSVLRNGKLVGTFNIKEIDERKIISLMIEKDLATRYPKYNVVGEREILRVEDFETSEVFVKQLTVREGEIVGLAGLVGSGRTEFVEALFGVRGIKRGKILVGGKEVKIRRPQDAIKAGLFLIPEDRHRKGLFLKMSVLYNTTLPFLRHVLAFMGLVNSISEKQFAQSLLRKVDFDIVRIHEIVKNLSGGNKQKVLLARWIARVPKIYMLDEPTQGIDVGSKAEFFRIMCDLINESRCGVLLITSDLPELLALSDKVYVFRKGKIVNVFDRNVMSSELVLSSMVTGNVSNKGGDIQP